MKPIKPYKPDSNFLGRGWSFPPAFDIDAGRAVLVSDDDDIRQSLRVLFTTLRGERVMLPLYGCALQQFVFDGVSPALYARIRSELSNAILYYEPRIDVDAIDIEQTQPLNGWLRITVSYTIRQTNSRSNMVFPFYVAGEGTNVRVIE
jgi:phage baseplate assembly protein W